MTETTTPSEIIMFVPHLETRRGEAAFSRSPIKFTCDPQTPIVAMYKQELQGWRSARILTISREEITFILDETQPPTGTIRIVVAGESGVFPFRAVCTGKVVRVTQDQALGEAVHVTAHIKRWELIKPKARQRPMPIG